MKKKLSKLLGVGLTLALLTSLLLIAAPVSALTQPTVTFVTSGDAVISEVDADYTIIFTLGEELITIGDTITITFPSDTVITPGSLQATILASPGWFSDDATTTEGWEPSLTSPGSVTFSGNATARTVTATLPEDTTTEIGAGATVQIKITGGITNPSMTGDYTLTVKTSQETTAVTSASYSITAPVLAGGTVEVFNPSDVLMSQHTGNTAINDAVAAAEDDYTIVVGPGEYNIGSQIEIRLAGLTLKSSAGAGDTIIDATGISPNGIPIILYDEADDATIDGFTFIDSPKDAIHIRKGAEGVTVKNNIILDPGQSGIVLTYKVDLSVVGATITGNIIEGGGSGIYLHGGAKDTTISDNTITETGDSAITFGGGSTGYPTEGTTITGNTLTDNDGRGIWIFDPGWGGESKVFEDNVIEGNNISGNALSGIQIEASLDITDLVITGNDITDNDGVGIVVSSWTADSDAIKFNNISGNDADNDGYGIETTLGSGVDVDATHNWWGSSVASEVADMVYDSSDGDTDYTPFLTDTVDAVFSATAVDTDTTSLDAKTTVGVKVSGNYDADVISAAKYIDNPGAPLDNVLAFYDVYAAGATPGTTDTVTLKFYVGDANALLYAWSSMTDTWVAVSPAAEFSEFGGYLYVTLHASAATVVTVPTIEDLSGTPFAISGEPAVSDISAYYQGYSGDALVVETTDLLKAANDWADAVVPSGFTEAISTTQLLALANEWAAN